MTPEQLCEFEQRRLEMMRKHMANDPDMRRLRRKRYLMVMKSLLTSAVVMAVVLMLIKAFIMTYEGQAGYARLIEPYVETRDDASLISTALRPDPVSAKVAGFMSSFVPRRDIQEISIRPARAEPQQEAGAAPEAAPEPQPEPERLFPAPSTN